MADEKVYTPEVTQDNPFPGEVSSPIVVQSESSGGTYKPTTTKATDFPTRKIAVELIGSALNTRSKKILQEFALEQSGGLKIGDYKSGETGELSLTPNGLVAKNKAGLTTFAIDGTTGDAIFKGKVQSGAVVTGLLDVGDNSIVIDGESRRMVFYDESGIPVIVIGNV